MNPPVEPGFLTLEEVLEMHRALMQSAGFEAQVINEQMLASALEQPKWVWLYQQGDLFELAATYIFHLVMNHAFLDGNKRVAAMSADIFLRVNGVLFQPDPEEYAAAILAVIGRSLDKAGLADYLRRNSACV